MNWGKIILDEFQDITIRRKYRTIHYGAYIMRILLNIGVPMLDFDFTSISELDAKTLGLMCLPIWPPSQQIISFQQWSQNIQQGVPQPRDTSIASSSHTQHEEEEEEDDDTIQEIGP